MSNPLNTTHLRTRALIASIKPNVWHDLTRDKACNNVARFTFSVFASVTRL
jgi:hypothetical protein